MKFKITINDIKKAIKILSPIVNFDHAQLPYRYLFLAVHKDKIELKGYNDHIVGSAFINFYDLENSENKNIYISAKQFIGLVNSFNAGEIVFTIENNLLKIQCGRSNYKLPSLDEEVAKENLDPLNFNYNEQISKPFQEEDIKV